MKKIIFLVLLVLLLTSCINKKIENHINSNIKFYKEEYNDRYLEYSNNHKELSDKDVITRVNLGLDNRYYTNTKKSNHLNSTSILINKFIFVPDDYAPDNLVLMDKYSKSGIYLVKEAYDNFIEMASDAKKLNLNIRAISAYRDVSYQKNLYNKYLENDSMEKVDTYSARPGYSEHHTGLSIDVDNIYTSYEYFEYTDEYDFMINNCYKYGFILRYPKNKENITGYNYESWHYRYVGKDISTYIHKHGITFDEYYAQFIDIKKKKD